MQTSKGEIKLLPGLSGEKTFQNPDEAMEFISNLHSFSQKHKTYFKIEVSDGVNSYFLSPEFKVRWKPDPHANSVFDEQMLYNNDPVKGRYV